MGLFTRDRSISARLSRCRDNKAALQVARDIKTLGDCCEFIEHCPDACSTVGDKVLELIGDDRALLRIILSDTVSSHFRQKAFDRIHPSYYSEIASEAGGKLTMDMRERIRRTWAAEKREKLLKVIAETEDEQYLEDLLHIPEQYSTVAEKALRRLIDLYAKHKRSERDFNYKVIDLFSELPNYVPGALNKVLDPMALLMIVRGAKLDGYKEDALYRVLYVGHYHPAKNAYRLGLSESAYRDMLRFLTGHYEILPSKELSFFADDREALRELRRLIGSEKTKLDALRLQVERDYLPPGELLAEYRALRDSESRNAGEIRDLIAGKLCAAPLPLRESVLLGESLDFSGKVRVLRSVSAEKGEDVPALTRKCAQYLLQNPAPGCDPGRWYYEIGRAVAPSLAAELGIRFDSYEVQDEDQFGRYTYDRFIVSYGGKSYNV